MALVASIPGHWPTQSQNDIDNMDELFILPKLRTNLEPSNLQVPRSVSATSSMDSRDELFFDAPSPGPVPGRFDETSMPSYLSFEPVVESVTSSGPPDWRRYDPPEELLHAQEDTSDSLRLVLPQSIDRIRSRITEEIESRDAHSRSERPLGRAGRASVKPPRPQPLMSGGLSPLNASHHQSRLSAGSATSLLSADSGYVSTASEFPTATHSESPRTRPSIFTKFFKPKDQPVSALANLGGKSPSIKSAIANSIVVAIPSAISKGSTISASKPASSPVTTQPSTSECVSCLDDFSRGDMIHLTCHSYCNDCFQRLITTALESETHWPPKCCLNPISDKNILPHIDAPIRDKYKQRASEWSIPTSDRIYCSHASCSTWIPPKNINIPRHNAKCPKCSRKTCVACRAAAHTNGECPQDPALLETTRLAEQEGWRRCYSCHAFVEHNNGCRHMTCRCKAQFCYICGAQWRTCACTDAQLATVAQQAATRRQAAEARTAAEIAEAARRAREEEEERLAIQQVEEFMRAEAEREAAEAEAQRMLEEAERLQREEERRQREEARIAVVSTQFRNLNTELDSLGDIQRVLMAERYEFEVEMMKKEQSDALATLSLRHPQEIQALAAESKAKIDDSEHKFREEYRLRLAEERRIENEYVDELNKYWKGKPDGEYKARDARDELRRDQEKEYKYWDSYRRRQLLAIKEGEARKMEALRVKHRSEIKAVEGRAKIDEVEWARKREAEGRWVVEVVRERGVLLQELEQVAYARNETE